MKHPLEVYRHAKGLSQNELAAELGVSRMAVWRWISGTRLIDIDMVPVIAGKTGIPPRELRPDIAEMILAAPAAPSEAGA